MRTVFPLAEGIELDLFHPSVMTEPAVNRARSPDGAARPRPSSPNALDVEPASADPAVVMLVAHELRDPEVRQSLFGELARITAVGGRILLVEHTRNLAAFLAYGPGWWHFLPEQEWRKRSDVAGLQVVETKLFTAFVQVFVQEHAVR